MKPSIAIDLTLFFLSEKRKDLIHAQPSIQRLIVAGALWDLLDAGALWSIHQSTFSASSNLPKELIPLQPIYEVIQTRKAIRPSQFIHLLYQEKENKKTPIQNTLFNIIQHLESYQNVQINSLFVPRNIHLQLVERIRKAVLANWCNPTDEAFVYALSRGTFLRDAYFKGRYEKQCLSNRLKDIKYMGSRVGGWRIHELCQRFYIYDTFPHLL